MAKPQRYPEIDFLKGVACALMLFGHAVRMRMPAPAPLDKILLHLFDFSGPIFFFLSGMNVMTFTERNAGKPGFAATKFYLWSAAALYFLGYAYNINRNTLDQLDIFQGIALGTAAVYLLMRTRLPTWAHFLVAAAIYSIYLRFRVRLELNLIYPGFVALRNSVGPDADIWALARSGWGREFRQALPPAVRYWFLYFTPFYWTVFIYFGALCYRSVMRSAKWTCAWAAFFAALFVSGPFAMRNVFGPGKSLLDAVFLKNGLDLSLRGIPSYVMTTLGAAGLLYLAFRGRYRGAAALRNRWLKWTAARFELLGKESLMFLVVHWLAVMLVVPILTSFENWRPGEGRVAFSYLHGALALAATMWAVPRFVNWRDRWRAKPRYGRNVALFIAASFVAIFVFFLLRIPLVGYGATFGVSIGFAFIYPDVRDRLRRRFTAAAAAG